MAAEYAALVLADPIDLRKGYSLAIIGDKAHGLSA